MGAFSGALGSLFVEVGARISNFEAAMADVSKQIDATVANAGKQFAGFEKLGQSLTGIGVGLSAAVTAPLVGVGAAAVDASSRMEALLAGLISVTGSSEEASRQFERLEDVARLPGLGFEEAVKGSVRLQAAGLSATTAEGALKAFGNAIAAVGGGKAELDGVTLALSQVASKGKLFGEELNQINERVPQIRQALKDAFGTADTEALQKLGVSAEEFVTKVTAELAKIPPVTGGLKNSFENLSDTTSRSLAKLGDALAPVVTPLVAGLSAAVEAAGRVADAFTMLPAPVQAAAGAVAALVAAAGPIALVAGGAAIAIASLSAALVPLGLTLGGVVAAAAPVALVVAGVTAALAALGTWVYANWDPIVATLTSAWEGITEAWTAAWDGVAGALTGIWTNIAGGVELYFRPIAAFLSMIWDGVGGYFTSAWRGIAAALDSIWNAIRAMAASVFGGIVKVFENFIGWAAKIPGAAKLLNLDDVWKSASKASAELANAGKSVQTLATRATAAGASGKAIPKLSASIAEVGKKASDAEQAMKPLIKRNDELDAQARMLEASYKRKVEALAASRIELGKYAAATPVVLQANADLDASIATLTASAATADKAFRSTMDTLIASSMEAASAAGASFGRIDEAYRTLGVTSTATLNEQAAKAKEAYETIRDSGEASAADIDAAWQAYERSRVKSAGETAEAIAGADERGLVRIEDRLGVSIGRQRNAWEDLGQGISSIVGDFSRNISMSLFEGGGSFGERMQSALSRLGTAALDLFVKPFESAVTGLIDGAIKNLLGGGGLGGVQDAIKNIGSSIGGVFGGGSGGGASAPGIPSGGGSGAGGGAAGAIGSIGSIANIVGAVGSVVGAIGTFVTGARQESTLNAIEVHTGQSKEHLKHTLEKANETWPAMPELKSAFDAYVQHFAGLLDTNEQIAAVSNTYLPKLQDAIDRWYQYFGYFADLLTGQGNILSGMQGFYAQIEAYTQPALTYARQQAEALVGIRNLLGSTRPNVTINITGGSTQTGQSVIAALRAQGFVV